MTFSETCERIHRFQKMCRFSLSDTNKLIGTNAHHVQSISILDLTIR